MRGDRRLQSSRNSSSTHVLDQDPRPRAAVLAGVVEHRVRRAGRGRLRDIGVGEDHVGALPAQLEGAPLQLRRAAPMIALPTSVEPVKQILRTCGCSTKRCPTTDPRPGMTVKTPGGSPASRPSSASRIARQRRELGGLEHHRVPGRQGRGETPAGDRHREVPGHDHPDHAERLAEGDVDPTRHRDLSAEQPLRRGGVVVEDVARRCRPPSGHCRWCDPSCAPRARPAPRR